MCAALLAMAAGALAFFFLRGAGTRVARVVSVYRHISASARRRR